MPQRKDSLKNIKLPKVSVLSKSERISMMFYELKKTKLDRVLVKDDNKLIGVVTLRDVFMKLASKRFSNISPSSLSMAAFVTEKLFHVNEETTLEEAVNVMTRENVSGLPVLKQNGSPSGLLTKNFLISLLAAELTGKVEDHIIKIGYRAAVGTPLSTILNEILKDKDMREFVVLQNNTPLGIVGEKEFSVFLFSYLSEDNLHHMKSALQKYVINDIMTLMKEKLKDRDTVRKAAALFANTNLVIYPVVKEENFQGVIRRRELFDQLVR